MLNPELDGTDTLPDLKVRFCLPAVTEDLEFTGILAKFPDEVGDDPVPAPLADNVCEPVNPVRDF